MVDPSESPDLPRYVELLVQARKHKVLRPAPRATAPPCHPPVRARTVVDCDLDRLTSSEFQQSQHVKTFCSAGRIV